MNTDDKASVLTQTVTIIAVTGVATLSGTDLISVLLNAVTERAFSRVYMTICIGSTPTILYFDLYLYSAYAAHYVFFYYFISYTL